MSFHNTMPEPFINASMGRYAARALRLEVNVARMHMMANTFMRAPGEAAGSFALESAIDELADQLGMDPIALRLLNQPDKDPIDGHPFSLHETERVFREGAER